MASIAISCFHAYGSSRSGPNKGCILSSSGGYVIAHNTHSISGASVSMGDATVHISNLILMKGLQQLSISAISYL